MASEKASKAEQIEIGAGGNVTFSPGEGSPPGCLRFLLADRQEMMRFNHDGKVYVRGEEVDDNREIYRHFRRWLQLALVVPGDEAALRDITAIEEKDDPNKPPMDMYEKCVYAGETGVPEVFVAGRWYPLADYAVSNLHEQSKDAGTGSGGDTYPGPGGGCAGGGVSEDMAVCDKAAARDGKTRVTHGFIRDYMASNFVAYRPQQEIGGYQPDDTGKPIGEPPNCGSSVIPPGAMEALKAKVNGDPESVSGRSYGDFHNVEHLLSDKPLRRPNRTRPLDDRRSDDLK